VNDVSQTHRERLEFLKEYILSIDMGRRFVGDQLVTRKTAELEAAGFFHENPDSEDDDHFWACNEIGGVHLFALQTREMLWAQMTLIIWTFIEQLFSDAMISLTSSLGIEEQFDRNRSNKNLVRKWESFFHKTLNFKPCLTKEDWQDLEAFLRIRNFISHSTHRPGHPPRGAQLKAAKRMQGLTIEHDGLGISAKFLQSSYRLANHCLRALAGEHWLHSEKLDLPEITNAS
jgi:hypothetical protein